MMLYAATYQPGDSRQQNHARQRDLAAKLLCFAVRREYDVDAESLTVAKGPHGKPTFTDHPAKFSLSHCPGLVCCGIGEKELGVDCEKLRPCNPALARRVCSAEELLWLNAALDWEKAFLTLWTLKEAYLKYTGEGMHLGFQRALFRFEEGRPVCCDPAVRARCYEEIPGFVVSVCAKAGLPGEIVIMEEAALLNPF